MMVKTWIGKLNAWRTRKRDRAAARMLSSVYESSRVQAALRMGSKQPIDPIVLRVWREGAATAMQLLDVAIRDEIRKLESRHDL